MQATKTDTTRFTRQAHVSLYSQIASLENLTAGWHKVEENDGAAGVDRVTVLGFSIGVQQRLLELRHQLLEKRGILCVASTTERIVTENPDGSKTTVFRFIQFRPYFASTSTNP